MIIKRTRTTTESGPFVVKRDSAVSLMSVGVVIAILMMVTGVLLMVNNNTSSQNLQQAVRTD